MSKYLLVTIILSFGLSLNLPSKEMTCLPQNNISSNITATNVLELYTSEGCSSCPPAENFVNDLLYTEGLWKNFIPLVFHVDYWNYLGHQDPFSNQKNTLRQKKYATKWNAPNIYTPGFILNGVEWKNRNPLLLNKISDKKVGLLQANRVKNGYEIIFLPVKNYSNVLKVNMAILGLDKINHIKNGENKGKTLRHNFVVLEMNSMNFDSQKKIYKNFIDVNKNLLKGFKNYAFSIWVSEGKDNTPIQAIGGCL